MYHVNPPTQTTNYFNDVHAPKAKKKSKYRTYIIVKGEKALTKKSLRKKLKIVHTKIVSFSFVKSVFN